VNEVQIEIQGLQGRLTLYEKTAHTLTCTVKSRQSDGTMSAMSLTGFAVRVAFFDVVTSDSVTATALGNLDTELVGGVTADADQTTNPGKFTVSIGAGTIGVTEDKMDAVAEFLFSSTDDLASISHRGRKMAKILAAHSGG